MTRKVISTWIAVLALGIVPAASAFQAEDTTKTATQKVSKSKRTADTASKDGASATENATKTRSAPVKVVPDSDIAAARASGKVWVNTDTHVYHKGGQWYGATKQGQFMTEQEAIKAGYRAAKTK